MSLPSELSDLMLDEIVLEPVVGGPDKYNNFTYGPAVTVRCQLSRTNKRALDRRGRELTSTAQMILATPELVVTTDDRLTMPDGTQPAIIEVLSTPDSDGSPYYLEVRA